MAGGEFEEKKASIQYEVHLAKTKRRLSTSITYKIIKFQVVVTEIKANMLVTFRGKRERKLCLSIRTIRIKDNSNEHCSQGIIDHHMSRIYPSS